MNLVHSELTSDDGAIYATMGETKLRLPESLLKARPTLAEHVGKPVIIGLRPEDIEDATCLPSPNGSGVDVRVSLAEAMGAELIAHFPVAAKPIMEVIRPVAAGAVAEEDDSEALRLLTSDSETETIFTARLSPRSIAQTGSPLRVVFDVERLHFFDPETEDSIW